MTQQPIILMDNPTLGRWIQDDNGVHKLDIDNSILFSAKGVRFFGDFAYVVPMYVGHPKTNESENVEYYITNGEENEGNTFLWYKGYGEILYNVDYNDVECYYDNIIVYKRNYGETAVLLTVNEQRGVLSQSLSYNTIDRLTINHFRIKKTDGNYYLGTVSHSLKTNGELGMTMRIDPISSSPFYINEEEGIIQTENTNGELITVRNL